MKTMRHGVDYAGSANPVKNDDCWWGDDFTTEEEARAAFNAPVPDRSWCRTHTVHSVFLTRDGKAVDRRTNPAHDPQRIRRDDEQDELDSRNERAREAGMAFGCVGYNDAMGW